VQQIKYFPGIIDFSSFAVTPVAASPKGFSPFRFPALGMSSFGFTDNQRMAAP
jgi:hypothetical protein